MRLLTMIPAVALGAATLLTGPASVAQEPSPAPSPVAPAPAASPEQPSPATSPQAPSGSSSEASRAAEDATKKAKAITLEARHGSSTTGAIYLTQIGRTRTRVTVRIPKTGNYNLSIYQGSDCVDNLASARSAIALAPLNSAGVNAPESSTIVEMPIEKLQSGDYLLDVRSATERAALAQACAKLSK